MPINPTHRTVRIPRRDGAATRSALLEAALACFSEAPFEAVGVRTIASHAGVDQALVNRYFGTKEGLFQAVVEDIREGFGLDHIFRTEPRDRWGAAMARRVIHPNNEDQQLALSLRAGASDTVHRILHEHLYMPVHEQIRTAIGGPDATARASAIQAILTGAATSRLLQQLPDVTQPQYEATIARTLQLVVDGRDPTTS